MIKIAVSGSTGRMGKAVIEAIKQNNNLNLGIAIDENKNLNLVLDKFDILIDFTSPEATLKYLAECQNANKPMVIGTTGFNDKQLKIIHTVANNIPIVLAPNMSIGVNLSLKLLAMTARVIGKDSDIEIIEAHHRHKVDAPSGTALKMGEIIANTLGRDLSQCAVYGRQGIEKPRDRQTIGFSTIRGGDVVGEHTISFFMQGERVEITHKASSRLTFANGATHAASWLLHQPAGLYSMQDVLNL